MSTTDVVKEVKADLEAICAKMEALFKNGIKINFNLNTDPSTGKTTLAHFSASQDLKLD